jgi:uncharacterized protein
MAMQLERATFPFPLAVGAGGRIAASGGSDAIRGKIIQVLFTSPGERVNKPDFGCGLFNLVFEPNDLVVAAAMEFTIGQALTRWLRDEVLVDAVAVKVEEEHALVEVAYTTKRELAKQAVRIRFR